LTRQTIRAGREIERRLEAVGREVADVGALEAHDPGVGGEPASQLSEADVDRVHAADVPLQEAVGEASGGGSGVECAGAGHVEPEAVERRLELLAPPARVARVLAEDGELGGVGKTGPRRGDVAVGHAHLTGQHGGAGRAQVGQQASSHEQLVETRARRAGCHDPSVPGCGLRPHPTALAPSPLEPARVGVGILGEARIPATMVAVSRPPAAYRRLSDVDWERWVPRERATLLFVVRCDEILLMHKKRGLGAGKINGPGGRLEPGETPVACAIREVEEELCVTPEGVKERGELRFQFADGYALHGTVFSAADCRGEPRETDEGRPLWTPLDRIPYEAMWEDDRLWLPHLLEGRRFEGRFVFDGDTLLDYDVQLIA
jgi:8-oxo-dGTP diphosphatase